MNENCSLDCKYLGIRYIFKECAMTTSLMICHPEKFIFDRFLIPRLKFHKKLIQAELFNMLSIKRVN